MSIAIFPGTFDPVTLGHVDIIERSAKLFDEIIVVILDNSEKQCIFDVQQRLQFLQHACAHVKNARVCYDHGLTVDFAKRVFANAIIRGVRNSKDFEYEHDIASVNTHITNEIETILLYCNPKYSFVSSSMIKEMVMYKQDVRSFVSEEVAQALEINKRR